MPGGGLSPDYARWITCRPGFFLPVRVLSSLFRRLFLAHLDAAFKAGRLRFSGALSALTDPASFAQRLGGMRSIDWVVYASRHSAAPNKCSTI